MLVHLDVVVDALGAERVEAREGGAEVGEGLVGVCLALHSLK